MRQRAPCRLVMERPADTLAGQNAGAAMRMDVRRLARVNVSSRVAGAIEPPIDARRGRHRVSGVGYVRSGCLRPVDRLMMTVVDDAASASVTDLAEQIERELRSEPAVIVDHDPTVLVHDRLATLLGRMRSSDRMAVEADGRSLRVRVDQHAVRIPVMARRRLIAESSMARGRWPNWLAGRIVDALMMCVDDIPLAVDRMAGRRPTVRIDDGSTVTIEHVALAIN